MDTPISLNFFKRLELYQELQKSNRLTESKRLWKLEKAILKWTVKNHQHLDSRLSREKLKDILHKEGFSTSKIEELSHVIGNLLVRGYATTDHRQPADQEVLSIKITKEGLMLGEIIFDCESGNWWTKYKYPLFYWIVWLAVICGFLGILLATINQLIELIEKLK